MLRAAAQFAACATLVASLIGATRIILLHTSVKYTFADDRVQDLSTAVSKHSGSGRTIVAGFILHELSGGHIAPLPLFSGRPLIARSYKHDSWNYVDVIPQRYRANGGAGIEEFFDLYNITAVVTDDPFWRKFFLGQKDRYTMVWKTTGFALFVRNAPASGYFLSGTGEIIQQSEESLRLRLTSPEAVVRFHYYPFLESSSCTIEPFEAAPGVPFIKLRECGENNSITIRAGAAYRRFF